MFEYLIVVFAVFYFIYCKWFNPYRYTRDLDASLKSKRKPPHRTPPPFPNGWFQLFNSKEVKKGEPKLSECLGQQFVVFRGEDGKAYVAAAICPHLGANLAIYGEVEGNCIKCPFHGWKYDGNTGVCVNHKRMEDNRKTSEVKITTWTSIERNNMILVWHCISPDGTYNHEPSWYPKEIPEIENNLWSYRGITSHKIQAHIQDIPENIADARHFLYVHKMTPGTIPLYHHWKPKWKASYDPLIQTIFEDEEMHVKEFKEKQKKFLEVPHTSFLYFRQWSTINVFGYKLKLPFNLDLVGIQVGPGLVYLFFQTEFGKGVFVQSLTPIEENLQLLEHKIYTESWMPYWVSAFILYNEGEQVTNDAAIWSNKIHIMNPIVSSESDHLLLSWRKWYSQFYTVPDPKKNLTW